MRVPKEARAGSAKIRLSFPDWKAGKVVPAVIDLPIIGVPAEKAPPEQLKDLVKEYQGLLDAFEKALLEIKGIER